MNIALEHKSDSDRWKEGQSFSRKHRRRDPNATWCQKQAPYDFIKYWTNLREANSVFLRLQKYEPESERPGRTSGCHRSGQHVNAASWIFHTQLDVWATQQWGNVQKYRLVRGSHKHCGWLWTCDVTHQFYACSAFSPPLFMSPNIEMTAFTTPYCHLL